MPGVWAKIGEFRRDWGNEHVAECIRRGMAGEPGWFYGFEAGHVVGTPFQGDQAVTELLNLGVALGGRWACVMRPPEGACAAGKGGARGAA